MSLAAPATVTLHVLLFARYAELLGQDTLTVTLPAPATVGDLIARVRAEPGGTGLPARVLAAVNLVQASDATPIAEADEVALLPPLAGG